MLVLCDYHESLHFISFLSCLQLILPESSWAYWAGLLSNATEIHVNAPPRHRVMFDMPQYVYHDDMQQMYFGRYNSTVNDIVYDMRICGVHCNRNVTHQEVRELMVKRLGDQLCSSQCEIASKL